MILLVALLLQQDPVAAVDASLAGLGGGRGRTDAPLAADDVLYRRLVLDLHGRPADDAEVAAFKAAPDLRKAVDRLLDDPRFAARWARRLAEVLIGDPDRFEFRVAGVQPEVAPRAAAAFVAWLESKLAKDRPWTEIVRELLDARGTLAGDPAIAFSLSFYRGRGPAELFPEGVARRLLGIRLTCARCHDHPYDNWDTNHYQQLAAFRAGQEVGAIDGGAGVQLQYRDLLDYTVQGKTPPAPRFLFGEKPGKVDDRMRRLGEYMTAPSNRQLPAAMVNRIWAWLVGEALNHPVDDFNKMSPPISGPALKDLTDAFVAGGTAIKPLLRIVCATRAYRLSTPEEAPGDFRSFRHAAREKRQGRPPRQGEGVPPVGFEPHEAWTRWSKSGSGGALAYWTLPDREGKALSAELRIRKGRVGDLEPWSNRFAGQKFRTEALDGKVPGKLYELTGVYACDLRADGPYEGRLLLAELQRDKEFWHFELLGPIDTVDDWRKEFLSRVLQSAPP